MTKQIERRLAPFWKGLNDHEDSWTEQQLVAAVRGLPIPSADDTAQAPDQAAIVMPEIGPTPQPTIDPTATDPTSNNSPESDISPAERALSQTGFGLANCNPGNLPLFRGRAKTLASLSSSSRQGSTAQLTPREIQLSKDDTVNGQPIQAHLYKDASECPICFLYYPPFLNKTRCCDQAICSECFVQIKRPDPHQPEHHGPPPESGADVPTSPNDGQLVSEASQCPFCVTPEFGVTYEPPTFRRGIVYAGNQQPTSQPGPQSGMQADSPAMASSTSLGSVGPGQRRRTTSLSASAPQVITTDRIRPDWAKKLSDARASASRRGAAATALHNAAYMLGGQGLEARGIGLGRRRRMILQEGGGGDDSPSDMYPGRIGSRRNRVEDLEDLMMMEAIRQSLAAEEERKKKEEKDNKKEEKKKAKDASKEAKRNEKEARKASRSNSLYPSSANGSTATSLSITTSPPRGNSVQHSHTDVSGVSATAVSPNWPLPSRGKGKAREDEAGADQARPGLVSSGSGNGSATRNLSTPSSMTSSIMESPGNSFRSGQTTVLPIQTSSNENTGTNTPASATQSNKFVLEPVRNFQSLAAMVGDEGRSEQHIEQSAPIDPSPVSAAHTTSEQITPVSALHIQKQVQTSASTGNSGASTSDVARIGEDD